MELLQDNLTPTKTLATGFIFSISHFPSTFTGIASAFNISKNHEHCIEMDKNLQLKCLSIKCKRFCISHKTKCPLSTLSYKTKYDNVLIQWYKLGSPPTYIKRSCDYIIVNTTKDKKIIENTFLLSHNHKH